MPVLVLLIVFVVVPLAELYVILKVGDAIGAPLTIFLLALDSVLGALLLRSQGRAVWTRFSAQVRSGHVPHREVLDGALVIFGAAFLITPGFITDAIGFTLLIPPTRRLAARSLVRLAQRSFFVRMVDVRRGRTRGPTAGANGTVEGTAVAAEPAGRRDAAAAEPFGDPEPFAERPQRRLER